MEVTVGDSKEVSTLLVRDRSTDGARTWIAPDGLSTSDVGEMTESLTQRDTVAYGDYAVVEVEATGIYGAWANNDGLVDGLNLEIKEANPGKNRDAKSLSVDKSAKLTQTVRTDPSTLSSTRTRSRTPTARPSAKKTAKSNGKSHSP